jgi:hypothetical protein
VISLESVKKEEEVAGFHGKLTKPTLCKVSSFPSPAFFPAARPPLLAASVVTRAAYPEGGELRRSRSRAVLCNITCRVGAIKSQCRGAGRGT